MPVTLNDILLTVRELTFDRFVVPAIAFKAIAGKTISVGAAGILIKTGAVEDKEYLFADYPTFQALSEKLVEDQIVFSYTPYFNGAEETATLLPLTDKSLDTDLTLFRKQFFSDSYIKDLIIYYYYKVLNIRMDDEADLTDDLVGKLMYPSERHLCYWVAYHLVDKRRMYEQAAQYIGNAYTDGSGYSGSQPSNDLSETTIQIGSVFTLREEQGKGFFYDDFNRVGSDNVWGDRFTFWYKLMLYLRSLLENEFGDYSLRPDSVLQGQLELEKPLNLRSYFDSYPFTLSPLSRSIISESVPISI